MSAASVILDEARISACLTEMAVGIQRLIGNQSVVLVGIRQGGDVLADRLAGALGKMGVHVEAVGALDITLYRDDFGHRRHWPQVRASEIPVSLDQRTVVLVDDVLFTGRTIRAALDALMDYGRPDRVVLAVLVDRGQRQLPICPDVVGIRIELDRDRLCVAEFREQGAASDRVTVTGN